ncbi:MAG: carboxypeptidase regulatory-like domain-containing protein [Candidatus Baltobacteraceae bacterium]
MLRGASAAIALTVVLTVNGGFAIAGTTGAIVGTVVAASGSAPVVGARVSASSPSQAATVTTDASGRFSLLSLAPDTYTIVVSKPGFVPSTTAGISVLADQVQSLRFPLVAALKTIATVKTRSSMDVVRPGTTADVYSVNATVTRAVQGVGGGGDLNNAYSAIAIAPGTFVPPNQQGWNQAVYIRGGAYDQVGYEFDGVPVNRSLDNYPGGTVGTLGQQELQVYAGGGTAGESGSGLAGFINQVIKTGTSPGYASVSAGIGTPSYYHNLQLEVGGATPDRLFSYYAGFGGYNQTYRYYDQFNGAALGNAWGVPVIANNTSNLANLPGVYPTCGYVPRSGAGFYAGPDASPIYDPFSLQPGQPGYLPLPPGVHRDPGCYQTISPAFANYSNIINRETVVNLHVGLPHRRDAGRDDVQVLYNVDALLAPYYSSANDIGPHLAYQLNQLNLYRNKLPLSLAAPEVWGDFVTWPTGTYFGENAANVHAVAYFAPSSPGDRCANVTPEAPPGTPPALPGACPGGVYSAIPASTRETYSNDASIFKLQYQHNIGAKAYARIYGYTFYSDWFVHGPTTFTNDLEGIGVTAYDYELDSHTRGLAVSLADQVNSQHLLTLDANYTTAAAQSHNNTNFTNGLDSIATSYTNGVECFNPKNGSRAPCNAPSSGGTFASPVPPVTVPVPGASWQVTYTGNRGFERDIVPVFTTVALLDRWQPTDKLYAEIGLRAAVYQYLLGSTTDDGQDFWYTAGQNEFCYNPRTLQPYAKPAPPASGLPPTLFVGFDCPVDTSIQAHPVQTVHPNGLNGHLLLSNTYNPTMTDTALTPRIGLTYTANSNTVLRFSAGRYAQQPPTYQVQYSAKQNNLAYQLFEAFWQYGFTTPRHDTAVQFSNNYDASYEHRFNGTDASIKVSPYLRYATNQIYSISLPFSATGGLNSGTERVDGVELQLTKGDFARNGLSFLLSYTYTNAAEKWNNYAGTSINPIDPFNQDIANYNGLTKAGGGFRCYRNAHPDPSCTRPDGPGYNAPIWNPYYAMQPQPLLDRNGWYPVGLAFPYLSPNVVSLVVNYKHDKFAITPALTFNQGVPYGNPGDVLGIDPRTCKRNSHLMSGGIAVSNPNQADYTTCALADTQSGTSPGSLFIPNPTTGAFDSFGAFQQPSQLNLSMSLSYAVTANVKATLLLANLANACFGGTQTPWSRQYPPNSYTCGYITNPYYVSNFYNGTSANDRAANGVALNPAFAQPYIPGWADENVYVVPGPFNAYVQFNITL